VRADFTWYHDERLTCHRPAWPPIRSRLISR
jgi:hypothetical protein